MPTPRPTHRLTPEQAQAYASHAGPMWIGLRLVWGPAHVPGPVTVLKSYGELSAEATAFESALMAMVLPSRMGGTADGLKAVA